MSAILQKLSSKGFVVLKLDRDDARSKRVGITDAGRTAHRAGAARLTTAMERDLAGFDSADLLRAGPAILALREHLDQRRNARDGL